MNPIRERAAASLARNAPRPPAPVRVSLLYGAAICLVLAQVLGIYALWTRKADLIFALVMVALLVGAVIMGVIGVYDRLH
jgi:hypothetical protein